MKLLQEKILYIPVSIFIFFLLNSLTVILADDDGAKVATTRERIARLYEQAGRLRAVSTMVHKYLLYATDYTFYRQPINQSNTSSWNASNDSSNDGDITQKWWYNPTLPLSHHINYVEPDHLSGVEYSPRTRRFYYADCLHFDEIDTFHHKESKFRANEDILHCYGQLAYVSSEVGDRMFYISYRTPKLVNDSRIEYELYSQDMMRREENPMKIREFVDRPLALVAHPKSSSLFLATFDRDTNKSEVRMLDYNGVELAKLDVDDDLRSLALDYDEDRLYWVTSSDMVRSSKMDGTDIWTMSRTLPTVNTNNILVDGDWIYAKNRTSIWSVQKSGDKEAAIVPHDSNSSMKLYSEMKIYKMQQSLL